MAAFLTIPAGAQEPHADLCMYGCPSGSPVTNDIIICDIYILSSNDSTKFADWVAYHVTKDTIGQGPNKKLIDSQKKGGFYNPSQFVEKWRGKYGNSCV